MSNVHSIAVAIATIVAGSSAVGLFQPTLAARLHDTKMRDDVYVLPPPAELKAATLGHHAATVDMLWAKLLVEFGVHLSEKRAFPDIFLYLDAILELAPDYAPVYRFADTLICFRPDGGDERSGRDARRYLERGTKALPFDRDVWLEYGQFMAYMSPSYLQPGAELDEWKRLGAEALTRAVDLGSDATRSLGAATLLSRYGAKDSAIRALRRAYALTDSPEERDEISARLQALTSSADAERLQEDSRYLDARWRRGLPFLSRSAFVLVGPLRDTLACAGTRRSLAPECSNDWAAQLPSGRDE